MSSHGRENQPAAVAPELAVSAIPVRQGAGGHLETFVQHRARTMDFAAEVVVFPGGRVSQDDYTTPQDMAPDDAWLVRHQTAWARTWVAETDPERYLRTCRALVRACQREVLEETGWSVRPEAWIPWANWVTPPDLPKRFDTYFFVVAVAEGDVLSHQTTEADNSEWRTVTSLLGDYEEGRLRLMRPTLALLDQLRDVAAPGDLVTPAGAVVPCRPLRARPY